MGTREQQVTATLVELADTLVSDYDLLDYLDRLLERSTTVLDAAAGGVMLADGHDALQLLACTDERTRVLELFELQRQEGPCVDSHRLGQLVIEDDLARSARWPQFSVVAVERGYRSVYAFPLRLRGATIGALNLFREQPGGVAPADVQAARAFADMATIGILQQRAVRKAQELASQLQAALNSRIVIEQAKGVLAERLGYGMGEAYQALRWYARNQNLHLREVAGGVVSGELPAGALRQPGRPPR